MNKQLEYYTKSGINPVAIETRGQSWGRHIRHRRNLYEGHLKIPISWFQGKQILEFGPNGGENAFIQAEHGAALTLVEPHEEMHSNIRGLFASAELSDNLLEISSETVETFEANSTYDLVVAEGFIHALPGRPEIIRKLCSLSSDKVIFTYSERHGHFFEGLKRYILRRVLQILRINEADWDKIFQLSKRLFYKEFDKLGSARSFESWVKDALLNPCITSSTLDSLDDLLGGIVNDGFSYYSGSPAWDNRHHHKWYKNTDLEEISAVYKRQIPFFITGKCNERVSNEAAAELIRLTNLMLDYSSGVGSCDPGKMIPNNVLGDWAYGEDLTKLLILAEKDDSEAIMELYLSSPVKSLWGMPQHYVCLSQK